MERDNNKMITQELQSAVKTIKAAILQSQVPELPGLKGFSEENIKLMRLFYETWKDIETISAVGTAEITNFNTQGRSANSVVETTELQEADSQKDAIRHMRGFDPASEDDIPDLLQRWQNLEAENNRTRKDQSFFVPVDEIRKNDYDLTFNKYKEVVREKVVYDDPKDVFARIEALEAQFAAKQQEFKEKYLK